MDPKTINYVTYYRVSTEKQGKSGLGLEAQCEAVGRYLERAGGRELATFREVESGKTNNRPQLMAALLRCRQTQATLLVAKLDRLSRNAAFLMSLRESGVRFCALDLPEVTTLMLGVLATIAEHEREVISARTKGALAARKARGLSMGTPRNLPRSDASTAAVASTANVTRAKAWAIGMGDTMKDARAHGCATLQSIADHFNALGILTARQSSWTPTAVSRLCRYIGAPGA